MPWWPAPPQGNWALTTDKIHCHLPKAGQSVNIFFGFFADCPIILTGGKEKAVGKDVLYRRPGRWQRKAGVAKVAVWQVAKESWWQRWRDTNGAHRRPLCHLPGR